MCALLLHGTCLLYTTRYYIRYNNRDNLTYYYNVYLNLDTHIIYIMGNTLCNIVIVGY